MTMRYLVAIFDSGRELSAIMIVAGLFDAILIICFYWSELDRESLGQNLMVYRSRLYNKILQNAQILVGSLFSGFQCAQLTQQECIILPLKIIKLHSSLD